MIRKPLDKNRNSLIPILLVLFAISLLYASYEHYGPFELKNELSEVEIAHIPEYFDYGIVSDGVYCNDFFRLRVPIPKRHEANYKIYDYIEKSFYVKDSVFAKPRLTAEIENHDLLLIIPELVKFDISKDLIKSGSFEAWQRYSSEKLKRESFGADYQLTIRVHNLAGASVDSYTNQFENLHNPKYANPKTKMISGIQFREYEGMESRGGSVQEVMFSSLGGKNKEITYYATEIHGFALSIELYYVTEEQKCILLNIIDTISFH